MAGLFLMVGLFLMAGLFPRWTTDTLVFKSDLKMRFCRMSFWTAMANGEPVSEVANLWNQACVLQGKDYRIPHHTRQVVSQKCNFNEGEGCCCLAQWHPPYYPSTRRGYQRGRSRRIGSLRPAWATQRPCPKNKTKKSHNAHSSLVTSTKASKITNQDTKWKIQFLFGGKNNWFYCLSSSFC